MNLANKMFHVACERVYINNEHHFSSGGIGSINCSNVERVGSSAGAKHNRSIFGSVTKRGSFAFEHTCRPSNFLWNGSLDSFRKSNHLMYTFQDD